MYEGLLNTVARKVICQVCFQHDYEREKERMRVLGLSENKPVNVRYTVLGELLLNADGSGGGTVAIQRQRNNWTYFQTTFIVAPTIELICGKCFTQVYVRGNEILQGTAMIKRQGNMTNGTTQYAQQ